jgi:hypothetical protein
MHTVDITQVGAVLAILTPVCMVLYRQTKFEEKADRALEKIETVEKRLEKLDERHFAERVQMDERLLAMDRRMAHIESNVSELRVHADYTREKIG